MKKYAVLAVDGKPGGLSGYVCIENEWDEDCLPLRTDEPCILTRVWDTEESALHFAAESTRIWSRVYRGQMFKVVPVEHEFYIKLVA